jgi:hypothetical protein
MRTLQTEMLSCLALSRCVVRGRDLLSAETEEGTVETQQAGKLRVL